MRAIFVRKNSIQRIVGEAIYSIIKMSEILNVTIAEKSLKQIHI